VRRSARLVWPHFFLATIVVLVPTLLNEELTSSLETFRWYESPLVHLSIDVAATIFIGGLIGVREVTLAHARIAAAKRRRGGGGLQKPGASSDASSRWTRSVAESSAPAAHVAASREEP